MAIRHTIRVTRLAKKHWPFLLALLLFVAISFLVQSYTPALQALMQGTHPAVSVVVFLLLGIVLVMIPTASILPFMPLAVTLWGWPMAAAMTLTAWVIGGQILFEAARMFGKPLVHRMLTPSQRSLFAKLVQGDNLLHSVLVRTVVHGDMISYAFGLFTDIKRWEFGLISFIGLLPAAVLYAYFGSLPVSIQLLMIAVVLILALSTYRVVRQRNRKDPLLKQSIQMA